jgi:hypothetical protein
MSTNTPAIVRHEEVNICGSSILAVVTQDNKCYFSPRHVCDALGISWQGQHVKIMADPVLSTSVTEIVTQLPGSIQSRTYTMLPIEFLSGWLFTIKKVRPELQAKLNLYRAEAYHALDAWFRQGLRSNPTVQEVLSLPDFTNPAEAARAWADQYEKRQALEAENAKLAPKAQVYDAVVADKMMKVHEFARSLHGVNTVKTKQDLVKAGYLHREWGDYRVRTQYRDKLFVEKLNPFSGKMDIYVTDEGKKVMTKLYNEGCLTMKGGF